MRCPLILCSFFFSVTIEAQIWIQDFETNALGTAYTSTSVFTDNLNGHYNRTNGSNISNVVAPYSNQHGNFVWAGENLNITGGNGNGLPNTLSQLADARMPQHLIITPLQTWMTDRVTSQLKSLTAAHIQQLPTILPSQLMTTAHAPLNQY